MSTLIENMEVFPDKKEPVRMLLLSAARERKTIRYPVIYGLFEDKKELCAATNIWNACVWMTVEEVGRELATPQGAIYTAVLANKDGIPERGFWDQFRNARVEAYEKAKNLVLPRVDALELKQKIDIANFERERVYRHAAAHHP